MNTDNWLCTSWMPKCPDLGTNQLKELQTPMTPQQLRFWANFDFNKWRAPSLPIAMVDSPPPIVLACPFCKHIALDGDQSRLGGEGVAQGRPSRSHLCGKEIMFFLYLGAKPFPASNMKCCHLLNQLQGQPPICGTKKCPTSSILNVNQNHLSISISPNVSHIDQIPSNSMNFMQVPLKFKFMAFPRYQSISHVKFHFNYQRSPYPVQVGQPDARPRSWSGWRSSVTYTSWRDGSRSPGCELGWQTWGIGHH